MREVVRVWVAGSGLVEVYESVVCGKGLTEEVEEDQLVRDVARCHLGRIFAVCGLFDEPLHEVVRSAVVFARLQRLSLGFSILHDLNTPRHLRLEHPDDPPTPVPSRQAQNRHNHSPKRPRNKRPKNQPREPKTDPPLLDRLKILLTPTNRQSNNNPIRHATNRSPDSIVDQNLLPALISRSTLALAKMRVKSVPDLVQDVRYASVDLPRQISADDREIVDESVARPRSEPFETQDVVLDFGSCDDVLGLAGEPLGVTGRQDD